MEKLKRVDIDFLRFGRKREREKLYKKALTLGLIILFFILAFFYLSLIEEKRSLLQKKNSLEDQVLTQKESFKSKGKKLKEYEKKYKKLVNEINNTIDLKVYPLDGYVNYLKNYNTGVIITDFSFNPDFRILLNVKSQIYSSILNFKRYLEKKFACSITSDSKQGLYYVQSFVLREKNGEK